MPTPVFMLEHPRGRVLFETGFAEAVATDPTGHLGPLAETFKPKITLEDTIVPQLNRLGRQPADVDYVIMSCLYVDHTGGMRHFPDATFVVQRDELREARRPSPAVRAVVGDAYNAHDLIPTRAFRFLQLDGDLDLFGDGSVVVIRAPCHARGEQALVVRLPRTGTVVLPAGVMPQRANWEDEVLTGTLVVAPDRALQSMWKLKAIADREQATVLFHHDLAAWQAYRHVPAYYE